MDIDFSELNRSGWYEQRRLEQGDWDDEVLAISPRRVAAIKAEQPILPASPVEITVEEENLKRVAAVMIEGVAAEEAVQKVRAS